MRPTTSRSLAAFVAVGVLLGGCALVRSVPPPDTDPDITVRSGDHVVAVPVIPELRTGKLFVFFPGTSAPPDLYLSLVTRAAILGFHAVSLDYENTKAINFQVCAGQPAECYEQARVEILTGEESPYVEPDVDVTNSAFNRLKQLVEHEAANHPGEGWDQYLADGELRWDLMVVGGHSQGGGMAAMTAKLHEVDRVLLFGATEPQPWTTTWFATPPDRFWALAHTDEPHVAPISRSWANISLPGEPVETDTSVPASSSHRLLTNAQGCSGDPASNGYYHNCYVADGWMPPATSDGTPAFAALWSHMLTASP